MDESPALEINMNKTGLIKSLERRFGFTLVMTENWINQHTPNPDPPAVIQTPT